MAIQTTTILKGDLLTLASSGPIPALSPLKKLTPTTAVLTTEGQNLKKDPAFMASVELMARPAWMITFRMGGGDWPVQELCLCGRAVGTPVVGIRPSSPDTAEILRWESSSDFTSWWIGQYAQKSEETVPNFIPPSCSLEAFLMVLQSIDAFRRALMGSMLKHETVNNLQMTAADFNASCRSGMQTRDTRWLAPAFVVLVPGFGEYPLSGGAESLKIAHERGFLTLTADASGKEQRIGFGEAGRSMGLEFARTWLMGAGMEARLPAPEGTRAIARCFVAPTGLTNHFVSLETRSDGAVDANHQPLTAGDLSARLLAFLDSAAVASASPLPSVQAGIQAVQVAQEMQTGPQQPASQQPPIQSQSFQQPPTPQQPVQQPFVPQQPIQQPFAPSQPAGAPVFKFCSQCGAKLEPEAAFCLNCGTRQ